MTGKARIRPAAVEDAGALARLRHALYEEPGRAPERLDAYTARFAPFVQDALASDAWRIWVAELDDGFSRTPDPLVLHLTDEDA